MTEDVRARGVHFVGTIPLSNAEEVFRTAAGLVGDRLKRLPDGETGPRKDWVWIQLPILQNHPDTEETRVELPGRGELTLMSIRDGVATDDFELGNIGYADFAIESYAVFSRLQADGVIPAHVRFQVNLPTPAAICAVMARPDAAPALEAAYRRAMGVELDRILAAIPHHDLAVQWDTCLELLWIEGWREVHPWFDDVWDGVRGRMRDLAGLIPRDVELGFHLCYGDFGHQRQVDLPDASVLIRLANTLRQDAPRRVDYMHLPVRGDVDPTHYLAPLAGLELAPDADLYLGLITDDDGVEGARKRIAAARQHHDGFGIATECGMGRRSPDAIPPLLDMHHALSSPHA